MKENKIVIITPFYNPGVFLEMCINSILSQKYNNLKVVFIDDASTDGSFDKLPKNDERCILIKNQQRLTALENIHNAILNNCDNEDIVCIVDGDDWLYNKNVLSYINQYYNDNDCWIMYGSSTWTDGRKCFSSQYSEKEFDNIRKSPFRISHLRTFRAGLYLKIKEQDINFSSMKDINGDFYKSSYDTAMFFNLLEMAGFEKTKHNEKILYVYNRDNPISDDKVNQKLQWDVHNEVSNKRSLKKINDYK